MIGAWENKATCIRKGRGDNFILDKPTKGIMKGRNWQEFYIRHSQDLWEIGYEDTGKVIATVQDENPFDIKYVGVKSEERSSWKFELPGFGRRVIRQDIHKPGRYQWIFPELYQEDFYLDFAVKSGRDASLVFYESNGYDDETYEILIGEKNDKTLLRRNKEEDPIDVVDTPDILHEKHFRYFWVEYRGGNLKFGRWGEEDAIIEFNDENPLAVRYFGITSYKNKSWWRFYTPCPEPLHICEHESYTLKCSEGFIRIKSALYGRSNGGYCYRKGSVKEKSDCGDPKHSLRVLRGECSGEKECTIKASNSIFKDPCVGTFKYLQFEYSCCKCD
ncbi:L-rhamnose-binding lectin ELEL-1 [Holothuria leucospilota]|uniref:L-rhamnose-binding lectin ELEL-1 n=1 Tax=Holothuria leucospilota TaxID=206669 RepID=A0A9Q0YKH4_HOLLE|nr:L-rhamnose-binding lectin ELEL-1 [Holothuria leucospilota]